MLGGYGIGCMYGEGMKAPGGTPAIPAIIGCGGQGSEIRRKRQRKPIPVQGNKEHKRTQHIHELLLRLEPVQQHLHRTRAEVGVEGREEPCEETLEEEEL